MYNRIKNTLNRLGISLWRIVETKEESAELFFVRKELDMRRCKDVCKYEVTVFRDGEGEKPTRGATSVTLLSSMSDDALGEKLSGAYFAAGFAANPYYDLPDPVTAPTVQKEGELASASLMDSAWKISRALYAPDTREDAFINSSEVFVTRKTCRILSSCGTDISYTDASVEGEFVVQCTAPEDVEMHSTFAYTELETEALSSRVAETLSFVCDRAHASRTLKSGNYDVILSGDNLPTVLSYYVGRSSASMLYAGYSSWKIGDSVQGEACEGERLDLTLCATVPYDGEGIPMTDQPLLSEGKLLAVHGSNRFCRYLGVKPTGSYKKVKCNNGTISFSEMKQKPCLWAVSFSDFQMDEFSGHFGGEIRLAYLIEDGKITPVTGGSINGNLLESRKDLRFSTEQYVSSSYEGPYALLLKDISVAGI